MNCVHLARSVVISARLQLERARIASETLAVLGLPALVLNEQGEVLACNSLADALSNYVQWRAFHRIPLKDGYGSVALGLHRSVPDEFRTLAERELWRAPLRNSEPIPSAQF